MKEIRVKAISSLYIDEDGRRVRITVMGKYGEDVAGRNAMKWRPMTPGMVTMFSQASARTLMAPSPSKIVEGFDASDMAECRLIDAGDSWTTAIWEVRGGEVRGGEVREGARGVTVAQYLRMPLEVRRKMPKKQRQEIYGLWMNGGHGVAPEEIEAYETEIAIVLSDMWEEWGVKGYTREQVEGDAAETVIDSYPELRVAAYWSLVKSKGL